MQTPLHKRFSKDAPFPFDMTYKARKQPQQELPDHTHDWCELVYVYEGSGTFFIDTIFYDMLPGDLFIIPGNCIHRAYPDAEHPVNSTAIFFHPAFIQPLMGTGDHVSLLSCMEHVKRHRSFKLAVSHANQVALVGIIEHIHQEYISTELGAHYAVQLHLHRLLLQVNRMIGTIGAARGAESAAASEWLKSILLYIDTNLQEDLRLSSLCRRAAITPAHFSRVFKQSTGMTPTDYVNAKRIMLAKERLATTTDSILDIAESCGFESSSYFHKLFKKQTGKTPLVYRRRG
ncbi:AraC family transcriptional regulator [Paenibacillus sp. HB172176]|uniref:AraC family transcriptional regulator n=1 Tax=Paenibacillus sp. HB172176 TaxID=2493690 RepID=UPI00143BE335|nr:AraC family transcriptional regulator [Paenibacillus sp. HB172176]